MRQRRQGWQIGLLSLPSIAARVHVPFVPMNQLTLRATCALVLVCSLGLGLPRAAAQSTTASANPPTFDAVTIKPPNPGARHTRAGFYGAPGGRVFFGGTVRMLIDYAFNFRDYQVTGGPGWIASQWLEINAVPPDKSPSHNIEVRRAEPTAEQRLMFQSLLRDRFSFKFHLESKDGEVYILTRSRKPLQLQPPKDPRADPRAIILMRPGEVFDGEAMGTNTTTAYMAQMLSRYLQLPVLDQTGITGSYDYYLPATDPENHDMLSAVDSVVDRLGLTIKRGRGPIETLVIDHVEQPSAN